MTKFFYLPPQPLPEHSVTFHSRVPPALTSAEAAEGPLSGPFFGPKSEFLPSVTGEPIVVGVDEAGRGPVIGPMVYAAQYCSKTYYDDAEEGIKKCGFADSKKLTDDRRKELLIDINSNDQLGYIMTYMTARDISSDMMAPWRLIRNLNQQAHECTMDLIQNLLDKGLNVQHLYIDTVGPPDSYRRKLELRFPMIGDIRVEKKADDKFPIVSGASVCAKVSRDQWVESLGIAAGSGYPSDPNTKRWLRENVDPWFAWGNQIRYSWSTARELLLTNDKVIQMEFAEEKPVATAKVGIDDMMRGKTRKQLVGVAMDHFIKC